MSTTPRKRPFWKDVTWGLAVAFAILALAEGIYRLAERAPRYQPSELAGYENVPGYERGQDSINESGLRGPPVPERRPGDVRILAVGGSTTWGHRVADDETWPALLQRELHERGHDHVHVLNGGVSGWGLEQITNTLEGKWADELEPDVVLVYSGWNFPTLKRNPYVELYLSRARNASRPEWFYRIALVRWLGRRVQKLRHEAKEDDIDRAKAQIHADMKEVFPTLYARLKDLAEKKGFALRIIAYPALAQVAPTTPEATAAYAETVTRSEPSSAPPEEIVQKAAAHHEEALEIIRQSADEAGVPLWDVARGMEARLPADAPERAWLRYFDDPMHLNPRGNAAVAGVIADRAIGEGLAVAR